jgi:hypothetical protein
LYPIRDVLLTDGDASGEASGSNERSGRLAPLGQIPSVEPRKEEQRRAAVLSIDTKVQADIFSHQQTTPQGSAPGLWQQVPIPL